MTGSFVGVGESLRKTFIPIVDRTAPLCGPLAQAGGVLALGTFLDGEVDFYLHKLSKANRYRLSRAEIRELLRKLVQHNVSGLLTDYLGPFWSADYGVMWRSAQQSTSGD